MIFEKLLIRFYALFVMFFIVRACEYAPMIEVEYNFCLP
ncbi:MAG: hypothetical protein P857_134 [Candidatus Xenolissoclinum pacificiensis L6]|uniref:Uncharacterized protein n=1 Tax=Candidatus Xenolissoclinum pacificiensis L6 TaxID=1401685 RepID=W2UYP5_9RICK|nr:MAG: hypothetical protein P857_134 [Candidatus Xenolissoclinum pacificiensis L6]